MATNSSDVTAGTNATATQYNNLRKDLVLGVSDLGTETDGATITIDWSDKTKGKIRTVTLAGNRTLAFSNVTVGQSIILRVIQDSTGSRTLDFPANIKWRGSAEPSLIPTANKMDVFAFLCTSSGQYDGYILDQGMG